MRRPRALHALVGAAVAALALLALPAYTQPARLLEWLAALRLCG